jgi:hypothetical protein
MEATTAAQDVEAKPRESITGERKTLPSTETTNSASHGGIARGLLATTAFRVIRLSSKRPWTPQSSHISTSAE